MRHRASFGWITAAIFSAGGCTQDAAFAIHEAEVYQSPTFAAEEAARIDAAEHDLVPIHSLAVARNGWVAISQLQDFGVRIYEPSGTLVGSVGGAGRGPGEFVYINRVGWLGDTLWVADDRQSRITFFERGTENPRTFPVPTEATAMIRGEEQTFRWLVPIVVLANYDLLVSGQSEETSAILRIDGNGTGELIHERSRREDVRNVVANGTILDGDPFLTHPHSALSPDGRLLVAAKTRFDGRMGGSIEMSITDLANGAREDRLWRFTGASISRAAKDSVFEWRTRNLDPSIARAYRREAYVPRVHPPIRGVFIDNDHRVWLEMFSPDGAKSYVVLSSSAEVLGRLVLPGSQRLTGAIGDQLWVIETDDLDLQSLVRYRAVGL